MVRFSNLKAHIEDNTIKEVAKIVGIIQARMGSSRFPGKVMMDLCGYPVAHWVIERCMRASTLDEVVLATTTNEEDDCLIALSDNIGVRTYRGVEHDVLERFIKAARQYEATIVVRICADNPLVAPEEIDCIVMHHKCSGAEYSFNHRPALENRYPDGLGVEVVNTEVLNAISRLTVKPAHREHVTAYIWDHLSDFHVETVVAPPSIAGPDIKLDIDTERDLERLKLLLGATPCDIVAWDAVRIVRNYRRMIRKQRIG